jgi:type IV pilus assembly protein PilC
MLQGEGLAGPIARTTLFPNAAVQMLRVGETTGQLDVQLESAARFYEQELNYRLKKFTTLFEPAVMILMGVIVGFVAVALVQAMYGVYHQTGIQ